MKTSLVLLAVCVFAAAAVSQSSAQGTAQQPPCPDDCKYEESDPVCAADATDRQMTFDNICEFLKENCKKTSSDWDWTIIHRGECSSNYGSQ